MDTLPKTEVKKLNYRRNVNNNLSCNAFLTLVPAQEHKLYCNQKLDIILQDKKLKRVVVHALKTVPIDDLTDFDTLTSVGYTAEQFRAAYRQRHRDSQGHSFYAFYVALLKTI